MKMTFKPEHEVILHKMMDGKDTALASKAFGMPAYKVNGKMAVGLFTNGITFKVGAERAGELTKQADIQYFEPNPGRVWKDWVLIDKNFEAYANVFQEAVDYVLKETS
jgi:hypothetical protein